MAGQNETEIYRNVCPRNCYASCSILSHVRNGRLIKVEGDIRDGYTRGRLCAKGYAYTQYVYNEERLRYPLRQNPRGSGLWRRISWDEALGQIAAKILELNHRYGSNLSLAYNKGYGSISVLSSAVEGMFNGLGAHTKPQGNPCMAAGGDALAYSYGGIVSPDPEDMVYSRLIVLWGANPAWTATQQLAYIYAAREKGARFVVIDPVFSATAAKADIYVQLNPGTDGLLALALCKILLDEERYDHAFLRRRVWGWERFASYLRDYVSVAAAAKVTGIRPETMLELAGLYAESKPCANWVGFGLQRHANGGQNVRAINALSVISGNVGRRGAGLYYFHSGGDLLPQNLLRIRHNRDPKNNRHRYLDLNHFAEEGLRLSNPPLKFLWFAGRNIVTQDQELKPWQKLLERLELIVTADLFLTETAKVSDLVLPVTTAFEEWDLNTSYWHYWLSINQKAIPPYFEAKSDLEIARALTRKLNQTEADFSCFPAEKSALDWIKGELTPEVLSYYGLNNWKDLLNGPQKLHLEKLTDPTLPFAPFTETIRLYSDEAKNNSLPALPRFTANRQPTDFPLRLITPQSLLRIHSQYSTIRWLNTVKKGAIEHKVEINPAEAAARGIAEGESVLIYNSHGRVRSKLHLNSHLPRGVLLAYQGHPGLNTLAANLSADMGVFRSGSRGIPFYDTGVEIRKV